jgi:hypothetical protein
MWLWTECCRVVQARDSKTGTVLVFKTDKKPIDKLKKSIENRFSTVISFGFYQKLIGFQN